MSSIKFNHLTKEIEMKGTESFIESNFNKIQYLLVESCGVKKEMVSKAKTTQEPIPIVKVNAFQTSAEITGDELSKPSPTVQAGSALIPDISHELKSTRPPLRKYIRREGIPGAQRISVQVVEQKSSEISIASLKAKFGLSESKIGGIIRDAEKLGKIRKVMNGSYVWTQD